MQPSRYAHPNTEERRRVLIVDDDFSLRKILYRILENGGYEVLSASSPLEALAICQRSSPPIDLLITDFNMPEMTGLELARKCSSIHAALPVLYISGSNPVQALRADLENRRRGFLVKPFRGEALLRKTKEMLMQLDPAYSL